jgi:hypothetical protein
MADQFAGKVAVITGRSTGTGLATAKRLRHFPRCAHFAGGIVPGDGIFTTWSYRAGAGRAEAFLINPQPITAATAHQWGVVAEVAPNGKALSRAQELACLYLKAPELTRCNTRIHFIQSIEGAPGAGNWLRTFTRRSVCCRPREINPSQELNFRMPDQEEDAHHE